MLADADDYSGSNYESNALAWYATLHCNPHPPNPNPPKKHMHSAAGLFSLLVPWVSECTPNHSEPLIWGRWYDQQKHQMINRHIKWSTNISISWSSPHQSSLSRWEDVRILRGAPQNLKLPQLGQAQHNSNSKQKHKAKNTLDYKYKYQQNKQGQLFADIHKGGGDVWGQTYS